jgi:flagellar basal-body rod modification protein FlgD
MDGQEFASQLAQFSSLEQLVSMNDALAQNGEINGLLAQSINSGVASGLIGKEIEAEGNTFQMLGDKSQALRFDLGEAATSISIEIFNEAGEKVRTVDLGQRGAGEQEYVWDGADNDGNQLAAGNFTFNVVAKDAGGSDVATTTFTRGVVDRITFGPDGIFLWVGQTSVSMGDVNSVGEPGESHE